MQTSEGVDRDFAASVLIGDRDERPDQDLGDRRGPAPLAVDPQPLAIAPDAGPLDQRLSKRAIDEVGPTFSGSTVRGESQQRWIDNELGGNMGIINKDELARAVAERSGAERTAEQPGQGSGRGHAGGDREADRRRQRSAADRLREVLRSSAGGASGSQTGETIQIAAKRVPKFSAGAELKKAVQ